jgi:hypothetical protein
MEDTAHVITDGVGSAVHPDLARRRCRNVGIQPRRGDDEVIVREIRQVGTCLGKQQRAIGQLAADIAARPPDHATREGGTPDRLEIGAQGSNGIIGA